MLSVVTKPTILLLVTVTGTPISTIGTQDPADKYFDDPQCTIRKTIH
jgi:hypothetical protein